VSDRIEEKGPDAAAEQPLGSEVVTLLVEHHRAFRAFLEKRVGRREFAAEAGITANNAGVRVFRAREALRKRVVRSCGTCAEHGCLDCTCGTSGMGRCGDAATN
jgi:hypothetical protein